MSDKPSVDSIDIAGMRQFQDSVLTGVANVRLAEKPDAEDDIPVLPSLRSYQFPDIIASADGRAMLVYDKPLPDLVWWAEYDPDLAELSFITVGKKIFSFGSKIHHTVDTFLRLSDLIYLVQVDQNGEIVGAEERKLVVRRNGHA